MNASHSAATMRAGQRHIGRKSWLWPVLAAVLVPTGAGAREIVWSAHRQLSWNEFQGAVPRTAAADNVAMTAAALRWSYRYEIRGPLGSCTYEITEISSAAVFDGDRSWVRPAHRTQAVLAHEQGHFDIAQIHKTLFDAAVRGLVGATGPCKGKNRRKALADAGDTISAAVNAIYERVWDRLVYTQETYDAETRHGMDGNAQARWLAAIAAALRGDPEALGAASRRLADTL